MIQHHWMDKLTDEGYKNLTVCEVAPNTDFGQHTHDQVTVHVILKGELTMTDIHESITLYEGDQFEIPAGTTHSAMCGPDGLKMIVGTKQAD